MASAKIFRVNYKSDFILTLISDAGWMTPFCIKFWTGAPSQAYYVGWDGSTYTHCAYDPSEPTKLQVQFDDHHLPIGDLKYQVAYHFTVDDFPNDTEDEVLNQANITTIIDGETYQVMLDFNGETAPEIAFSLPSYANEVQRIANEEQRIAAEQQRISNEESRIAAETIRQQNEAQRIAQETARVNEFATLKSQSQAATRDANNAAVLANDKAQLAANKAALADAAATLANQKAQLAADKAALANDAAQLANEKAALAQQKAEYAQQQGGYAKDQGDYAKNQGDYAKEQGDTALADHQRAESDHGISVDDHVQAGQDHTRAESDHGIAVDDHTQAGNDHTRAESDHGIAVNDHTQAGNDHTRAESDHGIAVDDHTQAGNDHTRAESDHTRAESDHAAVEVYVDSLGVFDLSKHNAVGGVLATYADLSAALTALNALDSQYKYGGMSFKFVQTSDNKYVQFRYMSTDVATVATFTNTANWQGVDGVPTAGSDNLIKSGGVFKSIVSTDIGESLRDGNTGEGGQASYFSFNALPAGDYYIVINSASNLDNIFVGLATGAGNQYITQRLIDDKPILAGNHYFKVTLDGSEVKIKISTAYNQNIAPAGITWSINDTIIDSLNVAETSGSNKSKSVITLRKNTGSSSTPEYKNISSVDINAASKTKAGVMTADDRINQMNLTEYVIDTDVAVSDNTQFLTPVIETLKDGDFTAFELDIVENTTVFSTNSCLGVLLNGAYTNLNDFDKYSKKLFSLLSADTAGFRLYVKPNVVTSAGHLKARLKLYKINNNESLIFSYNLTSIDGLDNKTIDISPVIYSFGSPYAKFRIEVLENTIGLISGREKTYLMAHLGESNYDLIILDDNNSKIVEGSRGTPAFSIALRQASVTSTGRIVFAINLNVEYYKKEQKRFDNINNTTTDVKTDVKDVIDVVDEKLLVGGETANEFNYLKAQHINIGFDSSQSKLSDSFDYKFLFLFPLKENIDSTKHYVWNRFDGEDQSSYFEYICLFATKVPAAIGVDVIRGQYNSSFSRGYLDDFDSEYKYLYLGFWCQSSFHDYKTAIERIYAILKTVCFKESDTRSYFSSYVEYYKDKFVKDQQGIENAGKILGINNVGQVVPTNNVPQKDIYQLGGVPVSQGAENAGKTLVIDDGGNVVPGTVTPQGVLTGVVQYHQTDKVYLGADLLSGSTVVLGTGWSGNLSDGFTHASGNTDDLVIQYPTVEGKRYVIGLILGSASEASIYVSIGDSPIVDAYNGTTNANIGIKSEGGYLKISPSSGYNSTVKVTLKEVVTQEEAVSELVLPSRNVNHGNTTDDITGFWNVAIGADNTFRKNQNGSRNIAFGYSALANFISGTRNIGIGTFAMSQLVSGDHNVAIGSDSLWYINKASDNVAIGFGAFWQMPSGANFDAQRNTVIGTRTMNGALVSAYDNVTIGYNAGRCNNVTSPANNISIGNNSGFYAKENNVAVGHNAARYTNGNQNVAIGAEAGAVSNTEQNNSIAIGYSAKTTKSNQCVIGNSDVTEFILGGKKIVFNEGGSVTWETIS